MHSVGFEPTSANTLELESSSLDRSDTNAKELELRGVEPRTFRMQSGRATTVPQPRSSNTIQVRRILSM